MAEEVSIKGTLNTTEKKKVGIHLSIFAISYGVAQVLEIIVKALSDGSLDLGQYTIPIMGALTVILQIIRLMNSGTPKEEAAQP